MDIGGLQTDLAAVRLQFYFYWNQISGEWQTDFILNPNQILVKN